MISQQVAKKYSHALFALAKERSLIDTAWDQLNALADYLRKDRRFLDYMSAPQVSDEKKKALIKAAFEKSLEKPFYDFLLFLLRKRRIGYLIDIVEAFDLRVRENKGIARAVCITAGKITDEERQKLIGQLAAKTSHTIELVEKTDSSVIGGMIVMLQNQIVDGSIRHGLDQLRNRLMKVKVH